MAFLSRIWSKELTAKIARGQQVGLYGIHKIGKSSLLEQMRLKLHLSNPEMTVVSIEMNDSLSEAGDLYREIIDKLPGSLDRPDGRFVSSSIFRKELTAYHTRRGRGRPGHRLLLLLDEYAYLIPDRRGRHGLKGFQEVLGLFKALNQKGWLLVLPCGRTADLNRQASWGKDENPLIDMLHSFLGPLPREENNAMMETLGLRANDFRPGSTSRAVYDESGGHPAFSRALGSEIARDGQGTVTEERVRRAVDRLLVDRDQRNDFDGNLRKAAG